MIRWFCDDPAFAAIKQSFVRTLPTTRDAVLRDRRWYVPQKRVRDLARWDSRTFEPGHVVSDDPAFMVAVAMQCAQYRAYLFSPRWDDLRRRVIARERRLQRREQPLCEGCGEQPGTQVHHETYRRATSELLWRMWRMWSLLRR